MEQQRSGSMWGSQRTCSFDGCDLPLKAKDLCGGHYFQRRRGQDLRPLRDHSSRSAVCIAEGCERAHQALGYCKSHYSQIRRGQPVQPIRGRSTGSLNAKGYRMVYRPDEPGAGTNGQIPEHRFVMQQHLGRPLLPTESVHHRNGQRSDNRIENLELWSRSQPAGQRVIDKLKWAREILAQYEGMALP